MYATQQPWIDLYEALHDRETADAYTNVLEPWLGQHPDERRWLSDLAARTDSNWNAATPEDLCRLYAAFRVASTLLLRFQHGRADGSDFAGPNITVEGHQLFFEALGFRVPDITAFHPFFHEIVTVHQATSPSAPIELIEQRWPPLMLGNLMFCRAGCTVSGGTDHVVKEIAERSKLYWTFRRKDRPCEDHSHGWGGRSQWRTALRRDYLSPTAFHYNVDAEQSLAAVGDDAIDDLSLEAMRELVRHRCLVRTAADDSDLVPYRYSDIEAFRSAFDH